MRDSDDEADKAEPRATQAPQNSTYTGCLNQNLLLVPTMNFLQSKNKNIECYWLSKLITSRFLTFEYFMLPIFD